MKTLAVVTRSLYEKINDKDKCFVLIDDLKVPLAFVEINPPQFDQLSDQHGDFVLVKKSSFSLNYRDLGMMELAWNKLKTIEGDSFYSVGSEFAGYVKAIGKNVTSFKEGDLVTGNSSYPVAEYGAAPGIPSNHSSKEYEIYHFGKLIKVPSYISPIEAGAISIGTQTAASMIRKAHIKAGDNIIVTSVTSNTAFFLLNALWDGTYNVYGLSYSGKNTEPVKRQFPFIKEIYNVGEEDIPQNLMFDVILDSFSDTYLQSLIANLNDGARYVTCGIFNQSLKKAQDGEMINLPVLITNLILKNVSFITNCLGTTKDLKDGLKIYKSHKIFIDQVFTEEDSLDLFISKTYNLTSNKFGKVVYQYK